MTVSAYLAAVAINGALQAAGLSDQVQARAIGTREPGVDTRHAGVGSTSGSSGATTSTFTLAEGAWPSWRRVGDILVVAGQRYRLTHFSGSAPRFAGLPTGLAAQPFTLYRAVRLVLDGAASFRLSGTAAQSLGLPLGVWNTLQGTTGARVTDRVYYVEGYDLAAAGVQRGDLLVLNNGESFRIDRVLDDPSDPGPNQRVLLFDRMPADSTANWSIPSVIRSAAVDYERNGAYPGDLAKTEVFEAAAKVVVSNSRVVAQKGTQLAVDADAALRRALLAKDTLRFLGVKHRKAVRLPEDVLSVPTLQSVLASALQPHRYREHVDYIIEPFYRDSGGAPLPMLQFNDAVFIAPDQEPADVLWAETVAFNNEKNVEDLFGRLVGFWRDDAKTFARGFNYVSGVAGLLYAQQRGPNLFAMQVGAQILLGQPFAEVQGVIEEVRDQYAPSVGRMLVRDADGNSPTQSETVRAYYYRKDPNDPSATSGLGINPDTDLPWQEGQQIPQFAGVGAGVKIDDLYTDPTWWKTFVGSGVMHEVQKFHAFLCAFDVQAVDLANLALLASFLRRTRPTASRPLLVGAHNPHDDLDLLDRPRETAILHPNDSFRGYYAYCWDDYVGDGDTALHFDDGVARLDALIDNIVDLVDIVITVDWPGGTLSFPSPWPFTLGVPVIDVSGAETGVPGQSFAVSDGMDLAAGNYRTSRAAKTGPVQPPL